MRYLRTLLSHKFPTNFNSFSAPNNTYHYLILTCPQPPSLAPWRTESNHHVSSPRAAHHDIRLRRRTRCGRHARETAPRKPVSPLREARERNGASQTCVKAVEDFNERFTRGDGFPYLYADVCEHWAAVILGVPRFWTNAVVFIGPREKAHGNFIANGQTIFGASGTLPFDVTIRSTMVDLKSNHNTWFRPVDRSWRGEDLERERMEIVNVLKFLAPHIHRCRSLSLYTLLLGAMPLLYRHLHGPAPLLKMLTLQTDPMYYRDRLPLFSGDSKLLLDFSPILSSFAPPLEKLIVDGISFRDIRQHHAGIWETYGVKHCLTCSC